MGAAGVYLSKGYQLFLGEEKLEDPTFYDDEPVKPLSAQEIASLYQPILYKQTGRVDPPPEALYYRVITNHDVLCIQYFGYWAVQFWPSILQQFSLQHVYDYEPILLFLHKLGHLPFQVVFSGGDMLRGFHWIEVHTSDAYLDTSIPYLKVTTPIAPRCLYPFSFRGNRETSEELRIYKIADTLHPKRSKVGKFEGNRLKLAIAEYHHVYNIKKSRRKPLGDPPLRMLSDEVLTRWYTRYFVEKSVEPFQHDVSDPFTIPFIRYKKDVILSTIMVEDEILEENEDSVTLLLKVFEKVGPPITRLTQKNFLISIDNAPTICSIIEDETGSYQCTVDISTLTRGTHTVSIQVKDYIGLQSDALQQTIEKQ